VDSAVPWGAAVGVAADSIVGIGPERPFAAVRWTGLPCRPVRTRRTGKVRNANRCLGLGSHRARRCSGFNRDRLIGQGGQLLGCPPFILYDSGAILRAELERVAPGVNVRDCHYNC